jgi:hypothetical protein
MALDAIEKFRFTDDAVINLGDCAVVDHEPEMQEVDEPRLSLRSFFIHDWPYIAMLGLAIFGVALASVVRESMTAYWELLVPFFAAVCVLARWRDSQHQKLLGRLIRIEAFHWGAVLVAMNLIFFTDVSRMMNADAAALMVLLLLALGTFTAGAQIGSWRIAVVGVVLALGVPIVAWLERAALLLTLAGIVVAALAALLYLHHTHDIKKDARQTSA